MIAFPATIDAAAETTTAGSAGAALVPAPAPTAFLNDTESLGDEIARLAAHLHAATYQLLVLIREFDEREGWGVGFSPVPTGSPGAPASALDQPGKKSEWPGRWLRYR